MRSKLEFYYSSDDIARIQETAEWPEREIMPQIITSGTKSQKVYFLMSGLIHIMDKHGLYEYGLIHEGSYFGDISVIFDEPNEYSYCYNPYAGRSVQFLSIDAQEFLNICKSHPCSFEVMLERAWNKKLIYQNYKIITLIGFMKQLQKQPGFLRKKLLEGKTIPERIDTMYSVDIRIDLYRCLIE